MRDSGKLGNETDLKKQISNVLMKAENKLI